MRVILNPAAGGLRGKPGLERSLSRLAGATLRRTRAPGDAKELAREAVRDGEETVVAAGGDGTVQEVVNGLEEGLGRVRLGVVPLGTGNDLARSLGVPLRPERALRTIRAGRERAIDLIRCRGVGDRLLVNFAIGGFAGDIAERLGSARKRRWGRLAYLRAALGGLRGTRSWRAAVEVDGATPAERELLTVVVANGSRIGRGIPVAPRAELDDGRLDVVTVDALPAWRVPLLLARVLAGRHLDHPAVSFWRGRRVSVRSRTAMPFNGDGQPLGAGNARFESVPGALRVLVPA